MVLKLVIHITNRLRIYADTVWIICFLPEKACLEVFGFYNPKKGSNAPYFLSFLDYKIRIREKTHFFTL